MRSGLLSSASCLDIQVLVPAVARTKTWRMLMSDAEADGSKRRGIEDNVRGVTARGWLQVPDGPGPHAFHVAQ